MTDHQTYIQTKVNPILESLVTSLLLDKPQDPIGFMITWLGNGNNGQQSNGTTNGSPEHQLLREQVHQLRKDVKDLEQRLGIASNTNDNNSESEEEDDDDDCVEDLPSPPANTRPRTSVSAEAYGKWNVKQEYTPIIVEKDEGAKERIRSVLGRSFLFSELDRSSFEVVVGAMTEVRCNVGDRVIQQGDDGDSLFLIEEGIFHCKIGSKQSNPGEDIVVKTCEQGDVFGELALLYNCPRAASVDCAEVAGQSACLWKLDRATFNAIVKDFASKKRERYESFLKSVSILKDLGGYEVSQIADALRMREIGSGEDVVRQGEPGDIFYIVEEGSLYAWKDNDPSTSLMEYSNGSFFGELALLRSDVRAATVSARSDSKVLSIDRKTFSRLLGDLGQLLESYARKNY